MNDPREPDGHLDERVRELCLGLVDEAEQEAAAVHLANCRPCADQLATARRIYEGGLAVGDAHVAAEKLVAHDERQVPFSAAERAHLDRCAECRADLGVLRAAPALEGIVLGTDAAPPPDPARGAKAGSVGGSRGGRGRIRLDDARSLLRWSLAGAAGCAAVVLAVLLLDPEERVATDGFVRAKPIEVQLPRSAPEPETFESFWLVALGDYAAGRYGAAEGSLRRALEIDPHHAEAQLFLGSCVLLQDRVEEANSWIDSALAANPDARVRAEAEWQQLVARFALGSVTESSFEKLTQTAEAIASRRGPHAREAQELVARIRARRSRDS